MSLKKYFREINTGYITLLAIMLIGSVSLLYSEQSINSKIAYAEELAKPAAIELIVLTAPECETCFDTDNIIDVIMDQKTEILNTKEVAYNSEEGKKLVDQYKVKHIPTVLITGEIEKENISEMVEKYMEIVNEAAVWTTVLPIFIDTESDEVVGEISITYLIDSSCTECYEPSVVHKEILENKFGAYLTQEKTVDVNSEEGLALLASYEIIAVPTIILSSAASAYPSIASIWESIGSIEKDGNLVFTNLSSLNVIYKNLETGEVVNVNKN